MEYRVQAKMEKNLKKIRELGWEPEREEEDLWVDGEMHFNAFNGRWFNFATYEKGEINELKPKSEVFYFNLPIMYLPEWVLNEKHQKSVKKVIKRALQSANQDTLA